MKDHKFMIEFFKPIDGFTLLWYLLGFILVNHIIAVIYGFCAKSVRVEIQ